MTGKAVDGTKSSPLRQRMIDHWKNIWPQPATWLFYGASPDQPISKAALCR